MAACLWHVLAQKREGLANENAELAGRSHWSQPVNCINLHKHRTPHCTAEWTYCLFPIPWPKLPEGYGGWVIHPSNFEKISLVGQNAPTRRKKKPQNKRVCWNTKVVQPLHAIVLELSTWCSHCIRYITFQLLDYVFLINHHYKLSNTVLFIGRY